MTSKGRSSAGTRRPYSWLCEVVGYENLEGKGAPLYTADIPGNPASAGKQEKGGKKTKAKAVKDPNAPKRPLSAYLIFCKENRGRVLKESPGLSIGQVGKALGERWRAIGPEEKAGFEAKAKAAKAEYLKAVEAYNAGK